MQASRTTTRVLARNLRTPLRTQCRHYATETQSTAAKTGGVSGLTGGLAGGALVFLAGYTYYSYSGAKTIVDTASSAKSSFKSLSNKAPEPNEAIKWLKNTALGYAAFVPGAKGYVEGAFEELESVQREHGPEAEKIVNGAYEDLKGLSQKGNLDAETAMKAWTIIQSTVQKLGSLAGDSFSSVLSKHPEIQEKVGGNIDELKKKAEAYGPEAKKEIEKTYKQIQNVLSEGISTDTISKIQKLVKDTQERMQKFGDQAWEKGMEKAKPYLEKSPEIKKFIEENQDALKKGNVTEVWSKVSKALDSGKVDDLKDYLKDTTEKAKSGGKSLMGKGIEDYIKMVPGGSEVLKKVQALQEVAHERGDDAEEIVKKTWEEVRSVVEKRTKEIESLGKKAKKDADKKSS